MENDRILPPKYDVISCLAVGGRWITSQPDLHVILVKMLLDIQFHELFPHM